MTGMTLQSSEKGIKARRIIHEFFKQTFTEMT